MSENALATKANEAIMENLIVNGDLSGLSPKQRVQYYMQTCQSMGLNPYTKPFAYIRLNGKLTLYALKDTTDQLRKINGVSICNMDSKVVNDVYVVTVSAKDTTGRQDTSTGVVNIKGLGGENLANAMMKAETKAKRRVTLSICGLGMLDETEIETIKDAEPVTVADTGEIIESAATVDPSAMTYEQACEVTSSKGEKYGDLPSETLTHMLNAMNKKMSDGKYTAEEADEMTVKMHACHVILTHRAETGA